MAAQYWIVKSEPGTYSWERFSKEKRTVWDGVRNFEARNNLRAMREKDLVLFYHSGDQKAVVGLAKVVKAAYPDPSAKGEDWSCVDLAAVQPLEKPVTLAQMKRDPKLSEMALLRRPRLSVIPQSEAEFARVLELGDTKSP